MLRYFVTLLALLALPLAQASEPMASEPMGGHAVVYTGTLGRQAIVLEFTPGDEAMTAGRYFYVRHHRDIALSGKTGGDRVELREGWDAADTDPRVSLQRQADGSWRGSWQDAGGKRLPVTLTPARPAPPAVDAPAYLKQLYTTDRYEYLRLVGLKVVPGKRERFMGHTLQWRRIADAGIAFFQVLDGYPADQLARINQVLDDRMWHEATSHYGCLFNHMNDGNYDQTVTPRLLSANLVSVSVFTDYYCGGAHPDFGDVPINLNAHSARELTLSDLLWVGKGKPLHYVTDDNDKPLPGSASFEAWSAYRGDVLAPWLVRQWQRLYPQHLKAPADDDDCGYDDPAVWQFVSWHMTPTGIFLGPSFARVARVCEANDDWSVLPWRIVRQHPGRLPLNLPQ